MGFLDRLSIQSKLLLMLLSASIASMLVIAYIGYASGREAVMATIRNQLAGLCQTKKTMILNQFDTLRAEVIALSDDETFLRAIKAFKTGFAELNSKPIPPEMDQKLSDFYTQNFLPLLQKGLDAEPVLETYLPRIPASRYLQYQYIVKNPYPYLEKKDLFDSSGDGSAYDKAHKEFHPFLRLIKANFGFEDLMLIDSSSGEIVYTEQKTTEFATSLIDGPYTNSNLGDLFREIQKGMDRDDFRLVDFERYRPNLNNPASFIASPIFDENKMVGLLVFQLSIDGFSRTMTGNENWEKEGLGKTGEAYLVGSDLLMRTRSRELFEAKENEVLALRQKNASAEEIEKSRDEGLERFLAKMKSAGLTDQGINRIRQTRSAILALRVGSEAARKGIEGKTDTIFQTDYRGVPVIASFAPIELKGLIGGEKSRWAMVAKMDLDEALAPVHAFRRRVVTSAVIITLLVTLLSLLISRVFTHPLNQLTEAARKVSEGQVDVHVKVKSQDEFRELADVFNKMTRNLKSKTDLVAQKIRENEELLLNILPSSAVKRHKEGEKQFSESFADVTVLFADIGGLEQFAGQQSENKTMEILNELVVAFDDAAERHGVEKVKTVGESYMAVCGLSVQRPDHTNRMIEFAKELMRIVRRFSKDRKVALSLRIAINSGPVVGGVVGSNKFIYDLWGDTVSIARGIKTLSDENTIQVTRDVHDRLGDLQEFESLGEVELPGKGTLSLWSVKV